GNPGYGNLRYRHAEPVRHLAQGLDQSQIVIDIAVLKARARAAPIRCIGTLLRPVSTDEAARENAIGGDGDTELAAGRENVVLDAARDQGIFDLEIRDGVTL